MEGQAQALLLVAIVSGLTCQCTKAPIDRSSGIDLKAPGYCSDNIRNDTCWGNRLTLYTNVSITCEGKYNKTESYSWCTHNKTGYPACDTYKDRDQIKCLSEIYETCFCELDDRGRALCTCNKYMFWKVYPFIYIVLGLVMVVVFIVCHYMRVCKASPEEDEEDLTKSPEYIKSGGDGDI